MNYIGIDIHKRYSVACVQDVSGKIIKRVRACVQSAPQSPSWRLSRRTQCADRAADIAAMSHVKVLRDPVIGDDRFGSNHPGEGLLARIVLAEQPQVGKGNAQRIKAAIEKLSGGQFVMAADFLDRVGLTPFPLYDVGRQILHSVTKSPAAQDPAGSQYFDLLEAPACASCPPTFPSACLQIPLEGPSVRILFPKNGATFCYNAAISKSQQMLPLQSSWPDCEWFLNGRRLDRPLIFLERGTWTITAKAGGKIAQSNYVVE